MEEMVQRNWSAEEMARHWAKAYPEGSDKAFIALKELYMAHPEVLGF
jgi:hypothetical protein